MQKNFQNPNRKVVFLSNEEDSDDGQLYIDNNNTRYYSSESIAYEIANAEDLSGLSLEDAPI